MRVHTIALAIGLVSGSLNYTNAYAHQVTPEQREKSHAMLAQATAGSESLGNISRLAGATSSSSADYYNCSIDKYINAYDIVSVIKSHDSSCINPLFNVNVTQARTLFSSRNVNAVANALLNDLRRYDGTNDQNVAEMMYFIKAYTFTNFNFKDEVGKFTDSFKNTVTAALDAYFANPKSQNTDSQNAWVLQQALAIVDSIEQNAHFLPVIKRVINNYDVEMRDNLAMSSATYNVFGVLFRGHQNEDYQLAAGSNTDMADTLYRFYKKNRDLLGTKNEDILRETVREMARFVQYEGIRTTVSGYINEILTDYSIDGEGSVLWVGAAEMAEYYDAENCANYNVCDLGSELKPRILDTRHACSDTLRIRSQHTYGMQNEWICDTLGVQEDYFHQLLQTNNKPNTADFNDALELVIFDSQADYKTYGGIIYDISTNNGGMYLEGNPMRFNNQARFIAYEKDEYRPDFHVWNLQHEYVHYLDGRFNMAGDFADSIDANTIWWIEGLAEYVAYRDGYEKAIDIARTQAYKLSEIFENTYSSGQDRIYRWGYLAVRFMFENHRSDVDEILAFMRKGQYQAYQTYIDNIGTRYDADFNQWLTTVQLGENYIVKTGPTDEASIGSGVDTDTTSDTSLVVDWDANEGVISIDDEWKNLSEGAYTVDMQKGQLENRTYITIPENTKYLRIKVRADNGDTALFVSHDDFPTIFNYDYTSDTDGSGNETITIKKPEAGSYYIATLAKEHTTNVVTSVKYKVKKTAEELAAEAEAQAKALDPLVTRMTPKIAKSPLSSADNNTYYYITVKEGTERIVAKLSGGSGNADLYALAGQWPTETTFDGKSTKAGNTERVEIKNPPVGTIYFRILGDFEGASFKVNVVKQ